MYKYFFIFLVSSSTFSGLLLLYSHFAPTVSNHSSIKPTDTNVRHLDLDPPTLVAIHLYFKVTPSSTCLLTYYCFVCSLRVYVSYCSASILFLLFHLLPYVELYPTEIYPYLPICSTGAVDTYILQNKADRASKKWKNTHK